MSACVKFLFHISLLFVCLFSTAQTTLIDRLHEMQQNPILKEKVYVHTNKTSYFPDDVIWFKAYVGDSINHPSARTRILEVRLLDENGSQQLAKNISITEGTGLGQFELNDAIAPGKYYIEALTNYMRNFGEDHRYLQEITILGQPLSKISKDRNSKYDIQLLPESGNLVEDIENVLGIKAMHNGRSIGFQGIILNQQGDTITAFQSEHEGLGSCRFVYKKGETYSAKIKVRDTILEQAIPTALVEGVVLNIDNSDEEFLKVNLKVNEATFYNQVYSNYTLLYHQDRQLFQLYSIDRLDSVTSSLKTNKDIFLDGVHTVTLFANDRPVGQRKFYVETDRKKTSVSLEKLEVNTDSITYRVLSKGKGENLNADLSISILHKKSQAGNLKNNIKSAFFLRPHVRGYIQNPGYYFDTENEKRKEHLDLLLLTQGWTGYTLDEMIEDINPDEKYRFNTGFALKGKIKQASRHKKLVLIPDDLRIVDKVILKDRPEFVFQNLNVFKGDTIRVAYQNWLGKIIKPSKIAYDTTYNKNTYKILVPEGYEIMTDKENTGNNFDNTKKYGAILGNNDTIISYLDGTIDLDEVIVSTKKRSERYLQRRKTIEKYKHLVSDIGKYYDLPISEMSKNHNIVLLDFLSQQGYRLTTDNNMEYYLKGPGGNFASLFLDGRPVHPEELPSAHVRMEDIANVMFSNFGSGVGAFQVFTSGSNSKNPNELFDRFVVKNGYDRAKKYYSPLYVFEQSRPIDLLEVDWKPQLKTKKNGEVTFKIAKDSNIDGLLFVIQGFSNEGHLISKTILTD